MNHTHIHNLRHTPPFSRNVSFFQSIYDTVHFCPLVHRVSVRIESLYDTVHFCPTCVGRLWRPPRVPGPSHQHLRPSRHRVLRQRLRPGQLPRNLHQHQRLLRLDPGTDSTAHGLATILIIIVIRTTESASPRLATVCVGCGWDKAWKEKKEKKKGEREKEKKRSTRMIWKEYKDRI